MLTKGLSVDSIKVDHPVIYLRREGDTWSLSRLVKKRCDLLLNIPSRGRVASLNASVAASIVLYDVWRRRTHGA